MLVDNTIYTYQEYLKLELDTEVPYELINGKIVFMPPESFKNVDIAMYLMFLIIEKLGRNRVSNKAEIIISGSRVTARIPDITVYSEAGASLMKQKNTSVIDLDTPPPLMVVEVVSPGLKARERDFRYKRLEYAVRGIKNYWIVDPLNKKITFLILEKGVYEEQVFPRVGDAIAVNIPFSISIDEKSLFSQE